jgi:hypothetical protein
MSFVALLLVVVVAVGDCYAVVLLYERHEY